MYKWDRSRNTVFSTCIYTACIYALSKLKLWLILENTNITFYCAEGRTCNQRWKCCKFIFHQKRLDQYHILMHNVWTYKAFKSLLKNCYYILYIAWCMHLEKMEHNTSSSRFGFLKHNCSERNCFPQVPVALLCCWMTSGHPHKAMAMETSATLANSMQVQHRP